MRSNYIAVGEWIFGLIILGWMVVLTIQDYQRLRPGEPLTYALDDAYIHMAMAKNLSQSGVYGVTPEGFTSSSSSLLWITLLALVYRLLGVSEAAPLWLNLISGGLALWAAWLLLGRLAPGRSGVRLVGLLALTLLLPLPALILSGMETTLQVFLTLLFAFCVVAALQNPLAGPIRRADILLVVVGFFFSAVRYESLALIGLACFLLVLRRRLTLALALAGSALLPVLLYGLVSLGQGWYFLPNSVMLKAYEPVYDLQDLLLLLRKRGELLWKEPHLRALVVGVMAALVLDWKWPAHQGTGDGTFTFRWLAVLFLPAVTAQVLFGDLKWFYRYEAYVLALGMVALVGWMGAWLYRFRPRLGSTWLVPAVLVAGLFLFAPLWNRGQKALREIPGAMTNIYDQQIQMARFVKAYYTGSCVALNDIGAVSYLGDVCVIDLAGLATRETAQAVLEGRPLRPVMETLVQNKGARLAMVYDQWFKGEIPPGWTLVGSWTVERLVVLGGDTVSFYAVTPGEVEPLRKHLEEFSSRLPRSVRREVVR